MVVVHERGPSIIPPHVASVVAALARLRQGEPGSSELLDRATAVAEQDGRLGMLSHVAAARAEAAWLEGRHEAIAELTAADPRAGRPRGRAARSRRALPLEVARRAPR